MDFLSNLALGFSVATSLNSLIAVVMGVLVGMLVGTLPGVGALAGISLALPITFYMEPTTALIMLAGIFYGCQYGGSTASILMNIPGTSANAVTCLDGHPMAKKGKVGVALMVSVMSSFFGSTLAICLIAAFIPALASLALNFSSAEYFSIMLLGLVAASTISEGSPLKGLSMVSIGLVFGLVGMDVNTGLLRFTFGFLALGDGLNLIAVAMGLFGVAEILASIGKDHERLTNTGPIRFRSMVPSREEIKAARFPALRGTGIGWLIGALPGAGPTIATFLAYAVERRISRHPHKFGTGIVEGIAAPEAANNAASQSSFVPTLSLGVPGDAVAAIMMGAMLIHGIVPGPDFIANQPEIFWGLITSFWIGNLIILFISIPLIGVWVRVLSIPYRMMFPAIIFFTCVGVFSINNNVHDIYLLLVFGIIGYFLKRHGYPVASLLLGFVLGPLIEEHLRRALVISRGDFSIFFSRPISLVFLIVTVVLLMLPLMGVIGRVVKKNRPKEMNGGD